MADAKKNETKKFVERKNNSSLLLLAIFGIALLIFLGAFIINKNNKSKDEKKYQTSYLLENNAVNKIDDLNQVKQALNNKGEYFVLITYSKNKDTYTLETGLKKVIDKYNLKDKFYYLDIENIMENDNYISTINTIFNTDKIEKVPTILYYKDNKLVDVVKRIDNNIINAGDFQKLIDIYLGL